MGSPDLGTEAAKGFVAPNARCFGISQVPPSRRLLREMLDHVPP